MNQKNQLSLNLNYAHKNLAAAFRIVTGIIGLIILTAGAIGLFTNDSPNITEVFSYSSNIILGVIFMIVASGFLPGFAKKFFIINDKNIAFKLSLFRTRKSIDWNIIEEVEIDQNYMRIQTEESNKPILIYLGIVSYQDLELLNKAIIDMCLEKEVDFK